MEPIEKNVLDLAKSIYETSPASKVNFSKGTTVSFDKITPENRDFVHEATVKLGAVCTQHDHTRPVNFAANQILLAAQRKAHQAEQAKIKAAAEKKRLMSMSELGQAALKGAKQPVNPDLSKTEADKARLLKLGGPAPKPYSRPGENS